MAAKNKINTVLKFLTGKLNLSCLLLALLFTVLNHYAIYFPWILHEQDIIVSSTEYKKKINEHTKSTTDPYNQGIAKDFLLIDISNDLDLLCDPTKAEELGLVHDLKNSGALPCYAVPDVKKLTGLFKWLSKNQDKYNLVVCDIIFDKMNRTNENDTLLRYMSQIVQDSPTSKIIFSSIYDYNNKRFNSSTFSEILPANCKGAVNEELTDNLFFKYKLSYLNGKVKSLPLLMMEKINKITVQPGWLGFNKYSKPNGSFTRASNVFIPEMLYTNKDIDLLKMPKNSSPEDIIDSTVGKIELWQTLLRFDSTDNYYLEEVIKNTSPVKRNIFIGSFNHTNTDVHKTLYGDMDGGTILLNIYYNLLNNGNQVKFGYNLFTWFFFYLIFLLIVIHPENVYKGKFLLFRIIINFIVEESQYFLLVLMTILSSILFDRATNIIVLGGFLLLLSKLFSLYKTNKTSNQRRTRQIR